MSKYVKSFDEYCREMVKYPPGVKCMVYGCKKDGIFEGGDARCWCPMCEEHSGVERDYRSYLKGFLFQSTDTSGMNTESMYAFVKDYQERLERRLNKALADLEELKHG